MACKGPYNGSDAKVSFAEEAVCGEIPDNTVVSQWNNFGILLKITPQYKRDIDKLKVVGRRGIVSQRTKSIEAGADIEYYPSVASIYNIMRYEIGIDPNTGEPDGKWHNYVPTRSMELYTWNELPSGMEYFSEFYNMCVSDEVVIEIQAGELIKVTEKIKAVNMRTVSREQTNGDRLDPDGNSLGDFPPEIDPMYDEPLSAEDCDIYVVYESTYTETATVDAPTITLPNTPENVDNTDIKKFMEVLINGTRTENYTVSGDDVTVSSALTGDTIVITYFYRELVLEYSKVSITIGRESELRKGIVRGVKTGYTVRPKSKVLKVSITRDYNTSKELERMIKDEYMHFIVVIGNKEFRLIYGKWSGDPPPYEPETLIEHSLESDFSDILVVDA